MVVGRLNQPSKPVSITAGRVCCSPPAPRTVMEITASRVSVTMPVIILVLLACDHQSGGQMENPPAVTRFALPAREWRGDRMLFVRPSRSQTPRFLCRLPRTVHAHLSEAPIEYR